MTHTRILIDDGLSGRSIGGIGEYTRSLVDALHKTPLNNETGRSFDVETSGHIFRTWPTRKIARFAYMAKLQTLSPLLHASSRFDVVHFTNFYAPMWKLPGTKYVLTVHDLTGWENPHLVPVSKKIFVIMKKMTELGIARADAIVIPTAVSRDKLISKLNLNPEKVFVCPNIVKPVFELKQVSNRPPNLLVVVGTISHRKNTLLAVNAFAKVAGQFPDLKLVITGAKGDAYDEVVRQISHLNLGDRIEISHDLNDSELVDLYKKAALLIAPSHYEGFGIPIIEAMAIGLPVVASSLEVFQEVGGDAIEYFGDSSDVDSLALKLESLLGDSIKRQQMSDSGVIKAEKYSRTNVVGRYHHVYESITSS